MNICAIQVEKNEKYFKMIFNKVIEKTLKQSKN